MNYQEYNSRFAGIQAGEDRQIITDSGILNLKWLCFESQAFSSQNGQGSLDIAAVLQPNAPDFQIEENFAFKYPVILPSECSEKGRVLVLLHGLNERSWNKYWSWGAFLAENLKCPVLMFPISFHINRAPQFWSDARTVSGLMKSGDVSQSKAESTTFVNYILSQRLADNPLRFLKSGFQSALDLIQLINMLKSKQVDYLGQTDRIDFFAYSIGAFLSQILTIYNHITGNEIHKTAIFCGGAPFAKMNGISKLIMNKTAFQSIYKYYLEDTIREMKSGSPLGKFLSKHPMGQAFNAMINYDRAPSLIKSAFSSARNKIMVMTLKNDSVIPSAPTALLLRNTDGKVIEHDFPYPYMHENPFPVFSDNKMSAQVNTSFYNIFNQASEFLNDSKGGH